MNPTADQPIHKPQCNLELCQFRLAASGQQTSVTCGLSVTLTDPELQRVIEVWGVLSEPIKKAILALVSTLPKEATG